MSNLHAVTVPQWGLTMQEGTLAGWYKEIGDAVTPGDEVCDVETSKIANAVEAQGGGTLVAKVAQEGQTLPVGGLLAVLAEGEVGEDDIAAFIAEHKLEAKTAEAAASETLYADTPAGRIAYRAAGPEDAAGPAVLLLHGFGGDKDNWLFNISALAETRRVIALDLPGHGESAKDVGDGSLETLAARVGDAVDAIGLETVDAVGHSLGAAVAVALARLRPQMVARLALIAPAGFSETINGDYIDGFVAAERRKEMKPVLKRLFADDSLLSRDMVNAVLKMKRLDGATKALRTIADALFPQGRQAIDLRGAIKAVDKPVLVLWGDKDAVADRSGAEGLQSSTVKIIEAAGHMPQIERARAVNDALAAYLGDAGR